MAVVDRHAAASDEVLLAEHLAGVPAAGDALLSRHRDAVLQFVRWQVGDRGGAAEDVTQDVFVQVLRAAPGFAGRSTFRTWLYGVARRVCLRHLRARRRDRLRPVPEIEERTADLPDLGPDALQRLVSRDLAAAVRAGVAALPPRLGTVLALREWEGMSYGEIATALDLPVGTVRSRLNHARAALLHHLASVLDDAKEARP